MKKMLMVFAGALMLALSFGVGAQAVADKTFTIALNYWQPTYLGQSLINGNVCIKMYKNPLGTFTEYNACEPISYSPPANFQSYVYKADTAGGPWGSCVWAMNMGPGYGSTGWVGLGAALPTVQNNCGSALTATVTIDTALASDPNRASLGVSTHTFVFK
jgi:V8-like Glu-specific endopeptidase